MSRSFLPVLLLPPGRFGTTPPAPKAQVAGGRQPAFPVVQNREEEAESTAEANVIVTLSEGGKTPESYTNENPGQITHVGKDVQKGIKADTDDQQMVERTHWVEKEPRKMPPGARALGIPPMSAN